MAIRLLHTSDWHLGHTLHDVPREHEHAVFLAWLLAQIEAHAVDALLIAGDVFDVANPSAAALRQWYGFLSEARARFPSLDIVAIAGNHDSAARMEAPIDLLQALRIHVVGRLPRTPDGALDLDRLLVPLHGSDGEVAAWCAAVPFLRPSDLPRCANADDPLIEGVRRIYAQALEGAAARRAPGQALVAMGHCYMVSQPIAQLSERKVLGGNQHALPVEIFGEEVDYVALGHIHHAQAVGGREHVRYCGSPIPLSMGEVDYPHQVRLITLAEGSAAVIEALAVPRAVELIRVPARAPGTLEEVLPQLRALPEAGEGQSPFLEVRVRLDRPQPGLRREVTGALEGKHARLVKLTAEYTGDGRGPARSYRGKQLQDLGVEDVFRTLYASRHEGEPSEGLMECFRAVVELAQHGEGDAA